MGVSSPSFSHFQMLGCSSVIINFHQNKVRVVLPRQVRSEGCLISLTPTLSFKRRWDFKVPFNLINLACVRAQSCQIICDPMDCCPL